ncbi:MAG: serine/threonine protein kinase [Myxococcales bacterium]|nr:serine/threonine protein kinase [Myxococcales bacterium]
MIGADTLGVALRLLTRRSTWTSVSDNPGVFAPQALGFTEDGTYLPELRPRLSLSSYTLGPIIGRGGVAIVRLGWCPLAQIYVAVKCIPAVLMNTRPELSVAIEYELEAYRSFQHPAIVKMVNAGFVEGGDFCFVFEYLSGWSFERLFTHRLVSPAELQWMAVHVLQALQYIHEREWIHRDIKPSNLFLVTDPAGVQVRVLDFGLAVPLTDTSPAVEGTLEYMSPEQALGEPIDGRSDIWSLGAVMYRALTGLPPWPSNSMAERARSFMMESPPPLQSRNTILPKSLAAFIERCLYRDPADRWSNAAQALAALMKV